MFNTNMMFSIDILNYGINKLIDEVRSIIFVNLKLNLKEGILKDYSLFLFKGIKKK